MIPQVPRRKATIVATWRPTDELSLTGRRALFEPDVRNDRQ